LTVSIEICGAWPAPPPLMQETFNFLPNNEASIIEASFNIEHGFQARQEGDYSQPCVKLVLESENEDVDSGDDSDSETNYYRQRSNRPITSTEYFNIKKRSRVLVQSDKAKYKPGNTVQFRIIAIDDELRAVNASIEYEVISPSQNVMAAVAKQNAKQVVHGTFQLDKFAEQGEWQFFVRSTTNDHGEIVEETYSFDVEEYVLPKYELNIIADSFVIEGEDFPFVVEAEYTFGQPVPGDAKIQVSEVECSSRYYWNEPIAICGEFEKCQERGLDKSVINSDGRVGDTISAAEWNGLFDESRPNYCDKQFEIKVTWEDTASGETIKATKIINIEQEKYQIEVLYEPQVYKKKTGLNYIAQVKMIDGSTLDKEGQVEITVNAKKWNSKTREYDSETTRDTIVLNFQDAGIFQYLIPEEHVERLLGEENWSADLVMSFEEVVTSESVRIPKSSFEMEIESDAEGKLTPGTTIDLQIRADFTGEAVLFASSNGKIIAEYKIDAVENDEVVQSVEITSSMIPEVKFLVVSKAERENSDWAADSISFFVETNFDNEVLLSAPEKGELGQMIDIEIESAENSRVYLLGVDKSVLLLKVCSLKKRVVLDHFKSGNDIDGKRVLEAKQGGPDEEHGWRPWPIWGGCGIWFPWGYGSSAQQKIEDAGFATMKLGTGYISDAFFCFHE
jgi:CD109 antigen